MTPLSRPLARRSFACLLLLTALSAGAARIGDHTFDDRVRLAGSDLLLNGLGVRSVAWLKGFSAGLYLSERVTTPGQALGQSGPKRLQMKMILDVETKEFVKAFNVSLQRNNTETERAALKARVEQFDRTLAQIGKVKKGDVVNLDFIPGKGLVVSVNGAPQGTPVAGEDLYAGLLKVFIGDRPVDKNLKAGLLGAAPG